MSKLVVVLTMLMSLAISPLTLFAADHPPRTGNVMDFARSLPQGTVKNLEVSLEQYHRRYGIDITVVTLATTKALQLFPSADYNYAKELLDVWGVGTQKDDKGAVVAVFFSDGEPPMLAYTPKLDGVFRARSIVRAFVFEVAHSEGAENEDKTSRQAPEIAGLSTLMDMLHNYAPVPSADSSKEAVATNH